MKKIIIMLSALFLSSVVSYGQELTIDSLALTLREGVHIDISGIRKDICIAGENDFHCMEITATIKNTLDHTMHFDMLHNKSDKAYYSYRHGKVDDTQLLVWLDPTRDWTSRSLPLEPGKTMQVHLLAFMPLSNSDTKYWKESRTPKEYIPLKWRWKKNKPTNADYLDWFEKILPTMEIFVDCVVDGSDETYRISSPVDPEKVQISTDFEFRGNSGFRDELPEEMKDGRIQFLTVII